MFEILRLRGTKYLLFSMANLGGVVAVLYSMAHVGEGGGEALPWGRWVGSPWVGVGARCGGGGLAVDGGCSPWGCPPRSVLGEAAAADPFLRPSVLSV